MSAFTPAEAAYLNAQPLMRFASASASGRPDVAPVVFQLDGDDIVTGGYGVKYKPNDCLEIGLAYEIPYTERRDIIQDRLTLDLIVRY